MNLCDFREELHFFGVRIPVSTLNKFEIAAYIYGKKKQKIVDELFLGFYDKIVIDRQK